MDLRKKWEPLVNKDLTVNHHDKVIFISIDAFTVSPPTPSIGQRQKEGVAEK